MIQKWLNARMYILTVGDDIHHYTPSRFPICLLSLSQNHVFYPTLSLILSVLPFTLFLKWTCAIL